MYTQASQMLNLKVASVMMIERDYSNRNYIQNMFKKGNEKHTKTQDRSNEGCEYPEEDAKNK